EEGARLDGGALGDEHLDHLAGRARLHLDLHVRLDRAGRRRRLDDLAAADDVGRALLLGLRAEPSEQAERTAAHGGERDQAERDLLHGASLDPARASRSPARSASVSSALTRSTIARRRRSSDSRWLCWAVTSASGVVVPRAMRCSSARATSPARRAV